MGIEENASGGSVNASMTGIKRTVTGTLSSKPERIEVTINIITHNKNKLAGAIASTKVSNKAMIPAFSNENTSTKRLMKKKISLKSTFVR